MYYYIYEHPLLEKALKISYIYEYHSYWILRKNERIKNPAFNLIDRTFLDLKKNSPEAIDKFYQDLVSIFDCFDSIDKFNFAVIPSHDVNVKISPMHLIAQKLAIHYNKIDYSDVLQRFKTIARLSDGGTRNIGVHINSIRINPKFKVEGKNFILIDDITTSGSSMAAGVQILYIGGANSVTCLALSHKY